MRYTKVIKGDINGDGKIDEIDYVLALLHEKGVIGFKTWSKAETAYYDINSENIRKHIQGIEPLTKVIYKEVSE